MPAISRVPKTGNVSMFDGTVGLGATSIREVVADILGPVDADFNSILAKAKALASIEDFEPAYRPKTVALITKSSNFRGYPVLQGSTLIHYCESTGTYNDIC